MKFSLLREVLLEPLGLLTVVSPSKQLTFPVLSNVLFRINDKTIQLTISNLEVEVTVSLDNTDSLPSGQFTIPTRKFSEIVRNLPQNTVIHFSINENNAEISCNKTRYVLSTLPAVDFPLFEPITDFCSLQISQKILKKKIYNTEFCMAIKDVRYYLNGLLFEINNNTFNFVSTDGHRLAFDNTDEMKECSLLDVSEQSRLQALIPRRSILDLFKLIDYSDEPVTIEYTASYVKFSFSRLTFITKLIDSKFPEYNRVIPKSTQITIVINKSMLLEALKRVSILSTDQFRAIRMEFSENKLNLLLQSPEHEKVSEELSVAYTGNDLTIGFNITYLIDVLQHIDEDNICFNFTESLGSCLLHGENSDSPMYVVMPMRL